MKPAAYLLGKDIGVEGAQMNLYSDKQIHHLRGEGSQALSSHKSLFLMGLVLCDGLEAFGPQL